MEIADDFCPLKEIIMSINFFAVMVIYNRNLNDSLSFSSLKNTGVEIFVCDNSTKDMKNSAFESERVHILSMGGNVGLSKAYNKAVESIDGRDGYICFFDDDRDSRFPGCRLWNLSLPQARCLPYNIHGSLHWY